MNPKVAKARFHRRAPRPATINMLERAAAAFNARNLAQAENLYTLVLASGEMRHVALNMLGLIQYLRGNFDKAEHLIGRALAIEPGYANAHCNRAVVLNELKRYEEAIVSSDKALMLVPDYAEAHNNRGSALLQLERFEESLASCEKALKVRSIFPEASCNRGNTLLQLKRLEEALVSYEQALSAKPDYAEAICGRGNVLFQLGRLEEACASYDKALAINPHYAAVYCNRGVALFERQLFQQAIASHDRALTIKPDFPEAYLNRGVALFEIKRCEEALASYDKALALRPDYAVALSNRANSLTALKRFDEAVASCDRALAIDPQLAEAYSNRGNALAELARHEDALVSHKEALKINGKYFEAHCAIGDTLLRLMRLDESFTSYAKALAIQPSCAEAHLGQSNLNLLTGDLVRGWEEYEWRWKTRELRFAHRDMGRPLWLGESSLAGKTILLHSEQGLGDAIQFCRYAPYIAAGGVKVILAVPPQLKSIMSSMGVNVIGQDEPLPDFDFHCPLMSLPLAFKTRIESVPADIPYLMASKPRLEKWRETLSQATRLKVGVAWAGNQKHRNDHNRSIALRRMGHLLSMPDVQFFSLQKELRQDDADFLQHHCGMTHLGQQLATFDDTAAVISMLDLVISVDTSVAHLAGALGRPVWILLPFVPDWRWLLDRQDSPWYPTAQLFRQSRAGDWDGVIEQVAEELSGC